MPWQEDAPAAVDSTQGEDGVRGGKANCPPKWMLSQRPKCSPLPNLPNRRSRKQLQKRERREPVDGPEVEGTDVEADLDPDLEAEEAASEPSAWSPEGMQPWNPEPVAQPTPPATPYLRRPTIQFAPPSSVPIHDASSAPMDRPDPFPWGDRGSLIFSDSDELEQTLLVPRREQGDRFVLQFSTGESVTVFGTGLLGRNPIPQPGEYFDQLVSISDPGKSVSKTHLEFGQAAGSFWVSDRFSGNGSVVREPESAARRLEPGKRYRIVRGTRIDIGEQFFVVS